MKKFLDQAKHNHEFHHCLNEHFPEKFYDWKITVLFYIALHYVKALMLHRKVPIQQTHWDINHEIDPSRNEATCRITKTAFSNYYKLKRYSETARYEGIIGEDPSVFEESMKLDHEYCCKHLTDFALYIKAQGVKTSE